jgi:ribosomal protein S18 acetylase RimI-like enzyme
VNQKYFLRDAAAADAVVLARFAQDTFFETFGHLYPQSDIDAFVPTAYAPERWARDIADPMTACCLALRGDELVGYAKAGAHTLPYDPGDRRALELKNLYVIAEVKGQGVADALMRWALQWAKNGGADDFYLGVYCDNLRAQRFYARFGFEKVGEYFFPVGATRDHEFILRKRLR